MRSAVKNRVHAILAKHGIANEHSDLFGKGGRAFLDQLQLRDAPRRRLDSLMSLICDLTARSKPPPARSRSTPKPMTASTC